MGTYDTRGGHPRSPDDECDEVLASIELLAECPTTGETPGVAKDELYDQIIGACREFVKRGEPNEPDEQIWLPGGHNYTTKGT